MAACRPVDTDFEEAGVGASREALSTIRHRSNSTAGATGTTSLTLNKPVDAVAGEVLLARLINRNQVNAVVTAPAGWALLRSDQRAPQLKAWGFYKVAGGAEPASYTGASPRSPG